VVEIHEMKMDNNVMKMRQITGLDLAAGKMVELKPGSYHIMLLELKQQVREAMRCRSVWSRRSEQTDGRRSSSQGRWPGRSMPPRYTGEPRACIEPPWKQK